MIVVSSIIELKATQFPHYGYLAWFTLNGPPVASVCTFNDHPGAKVQILTVPEWEEGGIFAVTSLFAFQVELDSYSKRHLKFVGIKSPIEMFKGQENQGMASTILCRGWYQLYLKWDKDCQLSIHGALIIVMRSRETWRTVTHSYSDCYAQEEM